MENINTYKDLLIKYGCNYNEKAIVNKFKEGKYTFDNTKDDMTVVCLIRFNDLDDLFAIVQYNHKINYKVHACEQFIQHVYLDNKLNLHISDSRMTNQCYYNMDKEDTIKQYNWTMKRLNLGGEIDKLYYKKYTKVIVDNTIFRVFN